MSHSWLVLTPPLLVLIVAIATRKVIISILAGIICAAFIATHFSINSTLTLIMSALLEESQISSLWNDQGSLDHLYIFIFLIFLGIIISLITRTGGIAAYSNLINFRLKTQKSVETTSLFLSLFFFIDDYLNSLTVGCIMQPLTDKFKIPRAKLAFLLDSLSSPLCVIIPMSSWVAMIVMNLKTSGIAEQSTNIIYIKADPFSVYLSTIPYIFYAFFIIISAWVIVYFNISYSSMKSHELIAETTGNLFGGKTPLNINSLDLNCKIGSINNFFLPLGSFIILVLLLLLYTGQWYYLGGNNSFFQALQQTDSFFSLFMASTLSLIMSIIFFIYTRQLTLLELLSSAKSGFNLMKDSIIILLLAWTLGTILKDHLDVGNYLAGLIEGTLPLFLLPIIIFVISALICASTGSSWGTISIMAPLTIPLVVALQPESIHLNSTNVLYLYPVIGGLLSGSLAGSHLSPITDATIMASTSAGSYHLDHITTQISYIIPAILGTLIALLSSSLITLSYWPTTLISFTMGLITTLFIIFILQKISSSTRKS